MKNAIIIHGDPLRSVDDLAKIRTLKLTNAQALDDSYVRLEYEITNQ